MKASSSLRCNGPGFTLIEVMIVVAVVAILASIALPSYLESVRKSRRAEARAQLMEAVQYMQRFYSQNDSFKRAIGTDTDMVLPDALKLVPRQGAQTYAIDFSAALQPNSFTLAAVPVGAMKGDRCGSLQINSAGRRTLVDAKPGVMLDDCWR